jgi:hypothetical protein
MRSALIRVAVFAASSVMATSCGSGGDTQSAASTTTTSAAARSDGTDSCPPQERSEPRIASTERLDHTATDNANARFEAPGNAQPQISAADALGKLQPNSLSNSVDAVLASWTNLVPEPDAAPSLVWVLRNQNVEVAPSHGPLTCGEVAWVVDATTGIVQLGSSGAPLF